MKLPLTQEVRHGQRVILDADKIIIGVIFPEVGIVGKSPCVRAETNAALLCKFANEWHGFNEPKPTPEKSEFVPAELVSDVIQGLNEFFKGSK